MPELPEVETIRLQLIPEYTGRKLMAFEVREPRLLQNCTPEELKKALEGRCLKEIYRTGKFLIFNFSNRFVVFHLGMSGIFLKDESQSHYPQHIHLVFLFQSGKNLYYQDIRKFGKIWLYKERPQFPNLGIDPFDKKFSLNKFNKLINLKRKNIKLFLMDQSIVAGIGNIYASEILFEAGVSPLRSTDSLINREVKGIYLVIRSVLKKAIERFGTTYSAYRTVDGESGQNQHFLKVYQREGQPCYRCGTPIKKIILGSRSTFFCINCQK